MTPRLELVSEQLRQRQASLEPEPALPGLIDRVNREPADENLRQSARACVMFPDIKIRIAKIFARSSRVIVPASSAADSDASPISLALSF